jgi:hypothetical protein
MTTTPALNRVERACVRLARDGKPVTFTAVATLTGLGRSTLYRDPTIRGVIEANRQTAATGGAIASLTDEIATLTTALEALAEKVRRHEEQLRRLTARTD